MKKGPKIAPFCLGNIRVLKFLMILIDFRAPLFAYLHVKQWCDQQAEPLRNPGDHQTDQGKQTDPERFRRLAGHVVRDEYVRDGAKQLDRNVGHRHGDVVRPQRVPAVKVLPRNNRQFEWNCFGEREKMTLN